MQKARYISFTHTQFRQDPVSAAAFNAMQERMKKWRAYAQVAELPMGCADSKPLNVLTVPPPMCVQTLRERKEKLRARAETLFMEHEEEYMRDLVSKFMRLHHMLIVVYLVLNPFHVQCKLNKSSVVFLWCPSHATWPCTD
jgi:hypothetical protein